MTGLNIKNRMIVILLAAIVIVATGIFVYLRFIPWDGFGVVEAQSTIQTGNCQNTWTRDGGCEPGSIGCGVFDTLGMQTELWTAYNWALVTLNDGVTEYKFVILADVCSTGDHYNTNDPTTLLAGKCGCRPLGGPYSICCNGTTPVPATPVIYDPLNPVPWSDRWQPPTAVCSGTGVVKLKNTLTCASTTPSDKPPVGFQDTVDITACATAGWAYDPDTPTQAISVDLYLGGPKGSGTYLGTYTASGSRQDIITNNGVPASAGPNHGFNITLPSNYKDGISHVLYVYGINTNPDGSDTLLTNSITKSQLPIQCTAPQQPPPGPGPTCQPAVDIKVN